MVDTELEDPVADGLRSIALALFALAVVSWMALWSGVLPGPLDAVPAVAAIFGGFLLLQEGHRSRSHPVMMIGALVIVAVFTPFLLMLSGIRIPGGPWEAGVLIVLGGHTAWARLGHIERGLVLVGGTGVIAFLVLPPTDSYGAALHLASAATWVLGLVLAALHQRLEMPRP